MPAYASSTSDSSLLRIARIVNFVKIYLLLKEVEHGLRKIVYINPKDASNHVAVLASSVCINRNIFQLYN